MKKAALIMNFYSGKRKSRKKFGKYLDIFQSFGYDLLFFETKYSKHATEIIRDIDDDVSLVISVGGDGTFNEVVRGNLMRKNRLVLSHIPYGTTNDVGALFASGNSIEKNLIAILSGQKKKMDICTINDQPFVYVAGFGKFMNVPYDTSRKMKKKLGYFAYIIEGLRDFFYGKTHLYDITYEVDGESVRGLYSFCLFSNANKIAGIHHFYKDVLLDDGKFEVLFCTFQSKKDIAKSLFGLKIADITKIPGFYYYKTDCIRLTFHNKTKRAWCLDGEEYTSSSNTYVIRVIPDFEMMFPKTVSKELFIHA